MSQENVEIIRRFYEAQDDPSRILSFLDPAVVLTNTPKSPEAGTFAGHEGIRAWIVGVREAIDEPRWYADELIDVGQDRVIAPGGVLGRGRATNLPVDIRLTIIYTLREGKIAELHAYDTTKEALEAAGCANSPAAARPGRELYDGRGVPGRLVGESSSIFERASHHSVRS